MDHCSIVACLILAVIATLVMRSTFASTATIELNKSSNSMDLGLGESLGQQIGSETDLQTDLATETAILKSDSLALAVIRKLGLTSQPPFVQKGEDASTPELSPEFSPETRTRLLRIFSSHLRWIRFVEHV